MRLPSPGRPETVNDESQRTQKIDDQSPRNAGDKPDVADAEGASSTQLAFSAAGHAANSADGGLRTAGKMEERSRTGSARTGS